MQVLVACSEEHFQSLDIHLLFTYCVLIFHISSNMFCKYPNQGHPVVLQ